MRLEGARVVLRPYVADELDIVLAGRIADGAVVPARTNRAQLERRLARSGRWVAGWLDLAIEADGRLVGDIGARRPKRAFPPGVVELGIEIFDPGDRGQGYGREALTLLVDYLFSEGGAERIQAGTSVENLAARRAFDRLGFKEEGVMRAFMPAREGRDDYVLTAITRADWQAARPAWHSSELVPTP